MDNKQIVEESLDEFGEMCKMDAFSDVIGEMMARQEESKKTTAEEKKVRQKKIDTVVEKAETKYGVMITPKVQDKLQGPKGPKLGKLGEIEEEPQDPPQ